MEKPFMKWATGQQQISALLTLYNLGPVMWKAFSHHGTIINVKLNTVIPWARFVSAMHDFDIQMLQLRVWMRMPSCDILKQTACFNSYCVAWVADDTALTSPLRIIFSIIRQIVKVGWRHTLMHFLFGRSRHFGSNPIVIVTRDKFTINSH